MRSLFFKSSHSPLMILFTISPLTEFNSDSASFVGKDNVKTIIVLGADSMLRLGSAPRSLVKMNTRHLQLMFYPKYKIKFLLASVAPLTTFLLVQELVFCVN